MPEGDTVFTIAAFLRGELKDRTLVSGHVRSTAGTRPRRAGEPVRPPGQVDDLSGRTVRDVYSHGKHLFVAFDDVTLVRSHLGMHGSWHTYAPGEAWRRPAQQASIVLHTGERVYVCFNASAVERLAAHGTRLHEIADRIGPDLVGPYDEAQVLRRVDRFSDRGTPLVDLLLDQRIASGIGNVYKSEVLFIERLNPSIGRGDLDAPQILALYHCAATLLGRNIGGGPRVTRPNGDGAGRYWVYRRRAQPCLVCDTPIEQALLGRDRRSTYWCPACQPSRRISAGGHNG